LSKYCSQCGNKLSDGAKFCSSCGKKIDNSSSTFTTNSSNTKPPLSQPDNNSNNTVPPPPPPPYSSNNNYYSDEPYKEPIYNPNSTLNNNSSNYNLNEGKLKTNSTSSFKIIIPITVLIITLLIGGFVYLKWNYIKDNITSFISTKLPNSDLNDSNSNIDNSQNNSNNNSNIDSSTDSNSNKEANTTLSDDMIKDYIALADSTALNLFRIASEAEQNGQIKQSFDSIRPLLQNCYSDTIVDNQLRPFYESDLGQWTYELGMAFPFYNKMYFDQCSFNVIQRTDSVVQVEIIDNNPESLVYNIYTLKRYDKIWKIESIELISNN
jgi:uncharacterized protein YxeA